MVENIFLIIILLELIAGFIVYLKNKSLKEIENENRLTGFELARKLSGDETHIIEKKGIISNYYDQKRDTVKLSEEVFNNQSIYASLTSLIVSNKNKTILNLRDLNDFLIIISYSMIIIGAFLNNLMLIRLGMIIYIIAIIIESYSLKIMINNINSLLKDEQYIKSSKIDNKTVISVALRNSLLLSIRFIRYIQ